MPSMVALTLVEGDDETPGFRITRNGAPFALGGMTVTAVIKRSPSVEDTDPGVYTLTEDDGITVTDPATGDITLAIPAAVNASPGTWYYKIKVTAEGDTKTAVHGWITVTDT